MSGKFPPLEGKIYSSPQVNSLAAGLRYIRTSISA